MNTVIDKTEIIEAINNTEDERILFGIKKLLQIDEEEIPAWHKDIVEQRWKDMQEGKAEFVSWDDVKDQIFK